jgi:hypothetical protein
MDIDTGYGELFVTVNRNDIEIQSIIMPHTFTRTTSQIPIKWKTLGVLY